MNIPPKVRELTNMWLRYARDDLATAQAIFADSSGNPSHVCFHAQQAAEKALKAGLVLLQIRFAKTHDLDVVRDLLPQGWRVKAGFPSLSPFLAWSVESRYPGFHPEPSKADASSALATAKSIVEIMAEDIVSNGG